MSVEKSVLYRIYAGGRWKGSVNNSPSTGNMQGDTAADLVRGKVNRKDDVDDRVRIGGGRGVGGGEESGTVSCEKRLLGIKFRK